MIVAASIYYVYGTSIYGTAVVAASIYGTTSDSVAGSTVPLVIMLGAGGHHRITELPK